MKISTAPCHGQFSFGCTSNNFLQEFHCLTSHFGGMIIQLWLLGNMCRRKHAGNLNMEIHVLTHLVQLLVSLLRGIILILYNSPLEAGGDRKCTCVLVLFFIVFCFSRRVSTQPELQSQVLCDWPRQTSGRIHTVIPRDWVLQTDTQGYECNSPAHRTNFHTSNLLTLMMFFISHAGGPLGSNWGYLEMTDKLCACLNDLKLILLTSGCNGKTPLGHWYHRARNLGLQDFSTLKNRGSLVAGWCHAEWATRRRCSL